MIEFQVIPPIITLIEFIILISGKEREGDSRENVSRLRVHTYTNGEAGMITAKPGFSKKMREREKEIEEKMHKETHRV